MKFNKTTMLFPTLIALILTMFTDTTSFAKTQIEIGVIPFSINTIENIAYTKNDLLDVIKKQLETEDITVVAKDMKQLEALIETNESSTIDHNLNESKLDGLLWGNINIVEDSYVLDINLMNKITNQPIINLHKNGTNIETIPKTITEVLSEITSILFEKKKDVISELKIVGNARIKNNAIFDVILTKTGDYFKKEKIAEDIKTLYGMGCFENITIERENGPTGLIVSFKIKENPIIKTISFVGNHKFNKKKIQEHMSIKNGSFFNTSQIQREINQLTALYKEANYHNIQIGSSIEKLDKNQVHLQLIFEEGNKIFIDNIYFDGNKTFTKKELENEVKSSEKHGLSWLTGSGELNKDILFHDENQLFNYYRNNGFINVKIGKTSLTFTDSSCSVTFTIEEGKRFLTGECTLEGDLILSQQEMQKNLKAPQHKWFNVSAIQQDIQFLTELYSNTGFVNTEISPITQEKHDDTIKLTYSLKKNKLVKIKNIEISGNTITRDFVIRRELTIKEQDVYNVNKIKMSLYNLRRLYYFDNVSIKEIKNECTDKITLDFKVKEKPTGQITFGAGYSSTDKFFVTGSVSKENFLGKGQSLRLSGTLGSDIDRYNLTFTEPWLFDIPLSGTLKVYKEVDEKLKNHTRNTNENTEKYKQIDTGLFLGISYPLSDFVRTSLGYNYNLSEGNPDEQENSNYKISSTAFTLLYDSKDGSFYTKTGAKYRLTCTYAGLGGNLGFVKLESSFAWYVPLNKKITVSLRARYGHIKGIDHDRYKPLRDTDLFYLGGMDSIRAYDYKTIGLESIMNEEGMLTSVKGGNQYVLFNGELTYPIYEDLNLLGVIFFDTGQVFNKNLNTLSTLKDGIGCGIRWLSPLGPMRLEAAYKINNTDKKIKWNFSIGAPF